MQLAYDIESGFPPVHGYDRYSGGVDKTNPGAPRVKWTNERSEGDVWCETVPVGFNAAERVFKIGGNANGFGDPAFEYLCRDVWDAAAEMLEQERSTLPEWRQGHLRLVHVLNHDWQVVWLRLSEVVADCYHAEVASLGEEATLELLSKPAGIDELLGNASMPAVARKFYEGHRFLLSDKESEMIGDNPEAVCLFKGSIPRMGRAGAWALICDTFVRWEDEWDWPDAEEAA